MFSSTVLGGGKVIPESNEWYVVANDYAMAEQFYAIADQMWRENNPETACCENLYGMAAQHGVFPRPASHAEGYAKLTGVPGSPVPPSFEISTSIGTFVSVGTVPLTIPDSGETIVRVRALTPGPDMNAAGDVTTGTLTTPAPGINPDVTICGGQFCGGAAAETCEQFRKRYLDRLAYQPRATMAWIKQKLLEFPCATRVCIREGSCCRCTPECTDCIDCGCKNCGSKMEFYVLFDDAFPCGIPPANVVNDITIWLFGEHQGYGEGQVEIGVCGSIYAPFPLMVNIAIDIEGCPSSSQKQIIQDQIQALFRRICPSIPLRAKQVELIVASVVGAEVNSQVYFEIVGYEDATPPYPRNLVYVTDCGDLVPECDVLPCLNQVSFSESVGKAAC
ncbi:baseplate J/gp47 family protein [Bradyrhizobium elkanii]|uniref:baseplate J/gp47 family protein n=1 Tax=Bradyrhizobium elkanii TaxID=29448 RepID=UPI0004B68B2D|nr:baseplate J/gp47 family protein [Bradyrhizobium elkanii]WLA79567.1 baseplate J/gp47 family protein [Bradyrhizobium elkanii]